eukprot:7754300-Lingulodinium_polyedra.AAC.1
MSGNGVASPAVVYPANAFVECCNPRAPRGNALAMRSCARVLGRVMERLRVAPDQQLCTLK